MKKTILETERLIMRPFQMGDEASILEFSSNPKTQEHTGDILRTTLDEAIGLIQNVWLSDYEKYGYGRFAVIYKPDKKLIGFCGFKYLPELNETDLGYRFLPEYWGMGIATESSIKMLEYGFSVLKLSNVIGTVFPQNKASSNVLKKLGFTYKGLKRYPGEDILGDLEWYSLSKEEYKAKEHE
jgi:RimJ/RimL family protein N-acetyltransferase